MPLAEVVRAATESPAKALKRPDLGTFAPGSVGDASILDLGEGAFDYVDSTGERLVGRARLAAQGVVIGGRIWHQA
jgi:dihydroorotase